MDGPIMLVPGLWRLTVNVDTEDVGLFHGLWPVPDGVALHSYLLAGSSGAVVIDPWSQGGYGLEELEADLLPLGRDLDSLSAWAFTGAGTAPAGRVSWGRPVPGAVHDLGGGVSLTEAGGFWVARPSGVLFSGESLAGLGWIEDEVWAEDLGEGPARYFDDEALRWFASRPLVPGALPEGVSSVAPAHGLAWRHAETAWARARRWQGWFSGPGVDEVALLWPAGGAYDGGVEALTEAVLAEGAGVQVLRVPGDDQASIAAALLRSSLIVAAAELDPGLWAGFRKDLWRPAAQTSPQNLAEGLRQHL